MFDTSRLGAWRDLSFFSTHLSSIERQIDGDFLPPARLTSAALERVQPDAVKVIILGQDPYHTASKADGLAFSIPQGFGGRLDSLGNIIKELQADLNVDRTRTDLQDWADQGVLLLNTALTVVEGQAGSHARIGWSNLVRDVLHHISDTPRAGVFWGNHAQGFADDLRGDHLKILSPHPSPLSAKRGFFGSRPFSKVNQWLITQGQEPIDWADR